MQEKLEKTYLSANFPDNFPFLPKPRLWKKMNGRGLSLLSSTSQKGCIEPTVVQYLVTGNTFYVFVVLVEQHLLYTKSLVNTNSFYANFTSTMFQNEIPFLT